MDKKQVIAEFKKLFPNGDPRFYEKVVELCQLHNDKNADYASKQNPLSNFTRVAKWAKEYELVTEGNEEAKVAIIYMLKQIDASLSLLQKKQKGKVEGIPKRLDDVAVYSILIELLYNTFGTKSVKIS